MDPLIPIEHIHYQKPKSLLSQVRKVFGFVATKEVPASIPKLAPELTFEDLNPLLAKQLTEVELQIGQLAQMRFEIAEERRKMQCPVRARVTQFEGLI